MKKTAPLSRPLKGEIILLIHGVPVPQGSKRAFFVKKLNRAVLTEANKNTKPWRQEISGAAAFAMQERGYPEPFERSVGMRVRLAFYFPRPKSLKKAIVTKTTKPDLDKLARAALDALTGTVFEDDSQVAKLELEKHFSSSPRMEAYISEYVDGEGRLL